MPPLEEVSLTEKAVYWEAGSPDRFGAPTVQPPVEIDVHWVQRLQASASPRGGTTALTGTIITDRPLVVGSVLYEGYLVDWNPNKSSMLLRVTGYTETPDIKGRWVTRQATLERLTGAVSAQMATALPAVPPAPASSSDKSLVYRQLAPALTWNITHNLGKYPSVTVVDSAGSWVVGDVTYPAQEIVMVSFSAAFAGTAYLN